MKAFFGIIEMLRGKYVNELSWWGRKYFIYNNSVKMIKYLKINITRKV